MLGVGGGVRRVHAPAEVALDLVVTHVVKGHDRGIVTVVELGTRFRQQIVAVVVFLGGVFAKPFLQCRHPELGFVGVVTPGIRFLGKVRSKRRMGFAGGPGEVTRRLVRRHTHVG